MPPASSGSRHAVIPADITCAADYAAQAVQHLDAATLAWIEGGSGADRTALANRHAFAAHSLLPRPFADLSAAGTAVQVGGLKLAAPIVLAPLAHQGLVCAEAEVATARGAAAADTCMIVSALATRTIEDIAAVAPGNTWCQLTFDGGRDGVRARLRQLEASGVTALAVTVDAALQAPSRRALAAGFVLPPHLRRAASVRAQTATTLFARQGADGVRLEQLAWLRDATTLPIFVKGVLHPADACALRDLGLAGVVVSNHGGRSIDGVCASLDALPAVRAAVGDTFTVLFDGGIRSGDDAFKALALGADAVLVGRLQVYALAVAGALGVAHMLHLLREELALVMAVTGCATPVAARHAGPLTRAMDGRP